MKRHAGEPEVGHAGGTGGGGAAEGVLDVGPGDAGILHRPPGGDRALVAATAWASFHAARRITYWLDPWARER